MAKWHLKDNTRRISHKGRGWAITHCGLYSNRKYRQRGVNICSRCTKAREEHYRQLYIVGPLRYWGV